MKRMITTTLLLMLVALGNACKDDPVEPPLKTRTIVVLVDLSSSLTEQEFTTVADNIRRIVEQAPPQSRLHFLAITRDVMGTTPLLDDTVPLSTSVAADNDLVKWRKKTMDNLIDSLKPMRASDALTDSKYASCIYDGLLRAGKIIQNSPGDASDVFVMSDMVEECQTSALGHPVKMDKVDIHSELEQVEQVKELSCDLHGARVFMVPPTRTQDHGTAVRPKWQDLEKYWMHVIAYCNASQRPKPSYDPDLPHDLFAVTDSPAATTPPVTASAAVAARR